MPSLRLLISFTFLLSAILAAPTTQPKKRSFKVTRIRQTNFVPHGPSALRKAYVKYFGLADISFIPSIDADKNRHSSTSSASTSSTSSTGNSGSDESGDVNASPTQNDAEFLSPVIVGGQTLTMDFDTGSSDMWVFNTNLAASDQSSHTIYDPTKSTTFQNTLSNSQFNISYGDGSFASGPVGVDTVDIGGATVDAQAIGLPNTVAASFVSDSANNGLVGLAFSTLNTVSPQPQKTFFDNVAPDLSAPLFTANLKHGTLGSYEFGVIDNTAFSGSLQSVPVDSSNGFWQFTSATASVNGQNVNLPSGSAIADTGTSLMLVDDALVTAYYQNVQGAQNSASSGGFVFPCDSDLPDVTVAMGDSGATATVSGSLMNFASAGKDQSGAQYCFGGLQSNQGLGFSIYGDVFFKSQFVVFDNSGPQLQFAPHA